MIEFNRTYKFANKLGNFELAVRTVEHPTPYGNGMMLSVLPSKAPKGVCIYDLCEQYDIRYEKAGSADDIHELAMAMLERSYGVEEAKYEEAQL